MIERYQRDGDDIANTQFYPEKNETYDLKESEVMPHLNRRLREHNSILIQRFRVLVDYFKQDMNTSFADNLKKEGDNYLASLEKDMAEKTEVLKTFDQILSIIKDLKLQFN